MYKTQILVALGGFNNQWIFEDYPMCFRLILNKYKIYFLNEVLALYRIHDNNFSKKFNGFEIANFIVLNYFRDNFLVKKELKIRLKQARNNDINKYVNLIKIYYKVDFTTIYKICLKLKLIKK